MGINRNRMRRFTNTRMRPPAASMDPSDIHKIKSPQACAEAGYIWNPGWNACVPVEAGMDASDIHKIKSPQACAEAGYVWNPGWNACMPVEHGMHKPGRRVYRFGSDPCDLFPFPGDPPVPGCSITTPGGRPHPASAQGTGRNRASATGRNLARATRFSNIRRR